MSNRAALDNMTLTLHEMAEEAKVSDDGERILELVETVRAMKNAAQDACRLIEMLASVAFDGEREVTVGKYQAAFRWSKQRKWTDNEELVAAVSRHVMWDKDTGEEATIQQLWTGIRGAFRLAGDNCRTTWLRDHDIDPDDFSDGPSKCAITITPIVSVVPGEAG